eukprot:1732481-Prymnesium_polylepis.1
MSLSSWKIPRAEFLSQFQDPIRAGKPSDRHAPHPHAAGDVSGSGACSSRCPVLSPPQARSR